MAGRTLLADLDSYEISTREELETYDEEKDYRKIVLVLYIEQMWNGTLGGWTHEKKFNKKDINKKLADGTFKKNVIKDVMNKEKTADRAKATKKKAEVKAEKDYNAIDKVKK